jgi:catechol 2,3-dioxygenase-like lactoylglutathione lyase family enzyme
MPEEKSSIMFLWPTWMGLIVEDLEAQRRYYQDIVGLKERRAGKDFVIFDVGSNMFELIAQSGVPPYEHKGFHVGFTVASIAEARTELISRGLEPVGEIQSDSGNFWCYFQDPEGNLYQLMETP